MATKKPSQAYRLANSSNTTSKNTPKTTPKKKAEKEKVKIPFFHHHCRFLHRIPCDVFESQWCAD